MGKEHTSIHEGVDNGHCRDDGAGVWVVAVASHDNLDRTWKTWFEKIYLVTNAQEENGKNRPGTKAVPFQCVSHPRERRGSSSCQMAWKVSLPLIF